MALFLTYFELRKKLTKMCSLKTDLLLNSLFLKHIFD